MKKPKRPTKRASGLITNSYYEPDTACPFVFADGYWHDDRGKYWPTLASWRKESADDAICMIKSPRAEKIDAARIAQSDLEKLLDWSAPPRTSSEVKKLMSKIGYATRRGLLIEDVLPVEIVFEYEDEPMATLSSGDPMMDMIFNPPALAYSRNPKWEIDPESIQKRKSWPARPFMVADIWHDLGTYRPVLTFGPEDPSKDAFCAVKPESRVRPTKAALIALIDLKKAEVLPKPICTETEALRFLSTIGYSVRPELNPADVTPADGVRESDDIGLNLLAIAMYREVEEYIRIGDPPIMKQTADRLKGIGLSDDEAIGLMCKALVEEYSRNPDHEMTAESAERVVQILSALPDFPDDD